MSELDAVREAANNKRLAIFAGSGLSVLPPAFLPDWRSFNQAVLEAVKTAAAVALADDPDARAALDTLTLDRIPVEAFSDQIVDGFSGADYFSVLDVLDGVATNVNHRALAELAARGALRAIVTTNFDTLIERAFRERGVALQVFAKTQDFERPPPFEHCVLYKIHGTVGADTTFVDTVSQKMRGLGAAKRTHLHAVYDAFHLCRRVLGRRPRVRPGLSRFRRTPRSLRNQNGVDVGRSRRRKDAPRSDRATRARERRASGRIDSGDLREPRRPRRNGCERR
jgi:hypothetical protein